VIIRSRTALTLRGKGNPVIDANGSLEPLWIDASDNIRVDGLVLEDSEYSVIYAELSDDVTIERCTIRGNVRWGIRSRGCDRMVISRNTIADSDWHGIILDTSGAEVSDIEVRGSRNSFARNKFKKTSP